MPAFSVSPCTLSVEVTRRTSARWSPDHGEEAACAAKEGARISVATKRTNALTRLDTDITRSLPGMGGARKRFGYVIMRPGTVRIRLPRELRRRYGRRVPRAGRRSFHPSVLVG